MGQNIKIIVIAHNIRSALNIGSIFRICDACAVNKLYLTGYTPHPRVTNDKRLNFEIEKTEQKILKAGLEGFKNTEYEYENSIDNLIKNLKNENYKIIAVEQSKKSTNIYDFRLKQNTALILGNEVTGVEPEILKICDETVEIPMKGKGKSLNVAVSLAVALYTITH